MLKATKYPISLSLLYLVISLNTVVLFAGCGREKQTANAGAAATAFVGSVAGAGAGNGAGGAAAYAGFASIGTGGNGAIGVTTTTVATAGSGATQTIPSTGTAGGGSVTPNQQSTCPSQATPLADGQCKSSSSGTFAVKVDIPVYWAARTLLGLVGVLDSGRGMFQFYAKVVINTTCPDGKWEGSFYVCGARLPVLYSTLVCEGYELQIADAVWDNGKNKSIPVTGAFAGYSLSDALSMNANNLLFGISLKEPSMVWPTADETYAFACPEGAGKKCFPDFDGDGKPGITVTTKGGGNLKDQGCIGLGTNNPYKRGNLPLSTDLSAIAGGATRAQELYVGMRLKTGGSLKPQTDCLNRIGEAIAENLNMRVVGCMVQEGTVDTFGTPAGPNQPCTDQEQAYFIDSHMPEFVPMKKGETPPDTLNVTDNSPSPGIFLSTQRLGDANQTFSCAQVRSAVFAETK